MVIILAPRFVLLGRHGARRLGYFGSHVRRFRRSVPLRSELLVQLVSFFLRHIRRSHPIFVT